MHELLKPWIERKSGVIVPDTNFSEEFPDFNYNDEATPGVAYDLDKGTKYWYMRSGCKDFDDLQKLLVLAEAPHVDPTENLDAAVFSSGMAAITTVIELLARGNDGKKFVAGDTLYHHSGKLMRNSKPSNLAETVFVDTTKPEQVRKSLEENKGNVVAIFYEPVTNPRIEYTDTRKISEIAHEHDVPVVVDNTFLSPCLQQPLMMGADIVIHSLTKYFSGEGDFLGGAVIGPYEFLSDDPKVEGLKDIRTTKGNILFSGHANEIAKRLSGLKQRMEDHCDNAEYIADKLKLNKNVEQVFYPKLIGQTRGGYAGGVLSFLLQGENEQEIFEREKTFMKYATQYGLTPKHKVSLGMPETVIIGEANVYSVIGNTFDQVKEILEKDNIPIGLVRTALGREKNKKELLGKIEGAIDHAYK